VFFTFCLLPAPFLLHFLTHKKYIMKPFPFLSTPLWAGVILFLSACGGNEQKTNTETTSSDTNTSTTTTTTTETPRGSTTITTPQTMLVAHQKTNDFTKWKMFYDSRDTNRMANGIHNYVIGRGVQDTSMVFVAMRADDVAKAKSYAKDPSRKQSLQKMGINTTPNFDVYTMTFQDTARISSDIRAMTTFSVKSWSAWQQSFEMGNQERMQNGLTTRAYGHMADDSNKVVVVVAVADTAKARMFWSSDSLKQRMARSGVIGQPKRFLYRVVQRY
jgi:hypothetical protein